MRSGGVDPFDEGGDAGYGEEQKSDEEEDADVGGLRVVGVAEAVAGDFEEEEEETGDDEKDEPERHGQSVGRYVRIVAVVIGCGDFTTGRLTEVDRREIWRLQLLRRVQADCATVEVKPAKLKAEPLRKVICAISRGLSRWQRVPA